MQTIQSHFLALVVGHWFNEWPVAYSGPTEPKWSDCTPRVKLKWNLDENTYMIIKLSALSQTPIEHFLLKIYLWNLSRGSMRRFCATYLLQTLYLSLIQISLTGSTMTAIRKSKDYVYGKWVYKVLGIWKGYYRVKKTITSFMHETVNWGKKW